MSTLFSLIREYNSIRNHSGRTQSWRCRRCLFTDSTEKTDNNSTRNWLQWIWRHNYLLPAWTYYQLTVTLCSILWFNPGNLVQTTDQACAQKVGSFKVRSIEHHSSIVHSTLSLVRVDGVLRGARCHCKLLQFITTHLLRAMLQLSRTYSYITR